MVTLFKCIHIEAVGELTVSPSETRCYYTYNEEVVTIPRTQKPRCNIVLLINIHIYIYVYDMLCSFMCCLDFASVICLLLLIVSRLRG